MARPPFLKFIFAKIWFPALFMVLTVTYPIFRCMQGYPNGQSHNIWYSRVLTIILARICLTVLRGVCLCYTMAYKLIKVQCCTQMIVDISKYFSLGY